MMIVKASQRHQNVSLPYITRLRPSFQSKCLLKPDAPSAIFDVLLSRPDKGDITSSINIKHQGQIC